MKKHWVFVILLCVMITISLILYPYLPQQIPSHWNWNGVIDDYQGRWFIFFPIGIYLFIAVLFPFLRHIDPKRDNYCRFHKVYDALMVLLLCFIFWMWVITITACFHPELIDIKLMMCLLLSLMFLILGNLMPKMKSNYFIGIRTPWTLADETVWFLTHRMAGKLWFFGGLLMLSGIFLQNNAFVLYILGLVMILGIIPCVYSYVIFQKMTHSNENEKG